MAAIPHGLMASGVLDDGSVICSDGKVRTPRDYADWVEAKKSPEPEERPLTYAEQVEAVRIWDELKRLFSF